MHRPPFKFEKDRKVVSKYFTTNLEAAITGNGRINMTDQELTEVAFRRFNDYWSQIYNDFDEELHGLSHFSYMFHTKDSHNSTIYSGWNFTVEEWDSPQQKSFWYDTNSTLLYGTDEFKIGNATVDQIRLRLQPERFVLKDQNVTKEILGIPFDFHDQVVSNVSLSPFLTLILQIIWNRATSVNSQNLIPLKSTFSTS